MNTFNDQLTVLDEQLEAYEPRTRWFIYIVIALSLLLMSWMFFTSDMIDELSSIKDENSALATKITQNSPQSYQSKIAQAKKTLLQKQGEITKLENDKQILLFQMSQSQGLVFDNRQYAKILDSLLARSVTLGLKIELMQSDDTDKVFYGKVKQFKTLTIQGSGNFRSIASFIAFIEEQKSLVEVERVTIHSDDEKPTFEAIVHYMGVAL
jgi:Tfp pilus assembly protein PilO